MPNPTFATVDDAILALEAPMRYLAARLARDEVQAILAECVRDVYDDE